MAKIDIAYQQAVDEQADSILGLQPEDFNKIPDYGTIETVIDGKSYSIGYWHYKHLNHVVFMADRRVCLILHQKYVSGVKMENGKLLKLNDNEAGHYY